MQTVVVESGDVLDDGQLHLRPGAPGAAGDQLGLKEPVSVWRTHLRSVS
jgi:hypothetical protein